MISKTLFVFLIGCAVVFASPVNRNEEPTKGIQGALSALEEFFKQVFGKLISKIGGAIAASLKQAFEKIGGELDSPQFKEAVKELQEIAKKIYKDDDEQEIDASGETKEILEKEIEKVTTIFEGLVEKALENLSEGKHEQVDATEFKKAVDDLKKLVDELFD